MEHMANLKQRSLGLNAGSLLALNLLFFLLCDFNWFFLIGSFSLFFLNFIFEWKLILSFITPIKKVLKTVSKDNLQSSEPEFSTEIIHKQIRLVVDEKNKNEEILNSLIEGVLVLDCEDKVIYANKMAEKIFQTALKKKSFQKMPKTMFLDKCMQLMQKAQKTGNLKSRTFVLEEKLGLYFDLVAIPQPRQELLLILQDKTADYKNLQIGKDFVSNASHELRTPITIIRGFAETLQDFPRLSPDMLKKITEKIINTSKRLENIISTLLMLADIDNPGKLKHAACSLKEILNKQKSELMFLHKNMHISLHLPEEEALILADPVLLDLAFRNLLENAIKYSDADPKVVISLVKKKQEFLISFKDQGIGMSKEDLEHIFERFYTADKVRSRKSKGVGLGLSLVKNIIEKHKGIIKVFSQPGQGSEFIVRLPLAASFKEADH